MTPRPNVVGRGTTRPGAPPFGVVVQPTEGDRLTAREAHAAQPPPAAPAEPPTTGRSGPVGPSPNASPDTPDTPATGRPPPARRRAGTGYEYAVHWRRADWSLGTKSRTRHFARRNDAERFVERLTAPQPESKWAHLAQAEVQVARRTVGAWEEEEGTW